MFRIYLFIQTFRWQRLWHTTQCYRCWASKSYACSQEWRNSCSLSTYCDKKKIKKKKIEPKLKSKDEHSEEEYVSEKPSVRSNRSNTSNETTPRKKDHTFGIDHHIKYNKNERLKHWLKEKDKIYMQHIKAEKVKKAWGKRNFDKW